MLPLVGVHPNKGTLKSAAGRLVGASSFFKLPRAVAIYKKPEKLHKEHCTRRFCLVPSRLRALLPNNVAFPSAEKQVCAHSVFPAPYCWPSTHISPSFFHPYLQ